MVSSNLNFYEILKFCQRGGIGVFLKTSNFEKYPKCIITYNYVFLNIICNISMSGVLQFPIFEEISISTKFRQNLFFRKMFIVLLVFAVLRIIFTKSFVYLQYASSFTWFRAISIFSKF
jgi:hypothetical protein